MLGESELCYETINCGKCFRTFFSENCRECADVYFSKDCIGCTYCFGSVGLRKKQYHWFNEPIGKEEFQRRLQNTSLGSRKSILKNVVESREFWLKFPRKHYLGHRNTNVSGEYIFNSKNAHNMYQVRYVEDGRYCQFITLAPAKDIYDLSEWGAGAELVCDSITVGQNSQNVQFCFASWSGAVNTQYCMYTPSCQDIFGCVNLKKKQYCILNKQYNKNEYEELRKKIIADLEKKPYVDNAGRVWKYGEFFPYNLSPFAYNESQALQYWPLSKKESIKKGWEWHDRAPSSYQITMPAEKVPDKIQKTDDAILNEIIACGDCGKAFRFIPLELSLLRRFGFPMANKCPNCRHLERMSHINPPNLWHRICQCSGTSSKNGVYKNTATHHHGINRCPNEFDTAYASDRPEIIYCEECYNAEVA